MKRGLFGLKRVEKHENAERTHERKETNRNAHRGKSGKNSV